MHTKNAGQILIALKRRDECIRYMYVYGHIRIYTERGTYETLLSLVVILVLIRFFIVYYSLM